MPRSSSDVCHGDIWNDRGHLVKTMEFVNFGVKYSFSLVFWLPGNLPVFVLGVGCGYQL